MMWFQFYDTVLCVGVCSASSQILKNGGFRKYHPADLSFYISLLDRITLSDSVAFAMNGDNV